VAVVGAGVMGHGIAEVCAISGYKVTSLDISEDILERAIESIARSLEKLHEKGTLKESPQIVLNRIKTTLNIEDLRDADLIIEAVTENEDIKKNVFRKLDSIVKSDAIFASNTSTIPITLLAKATNRPQKFIGLHFSNPPVLMPLVEIIRGEDTDQITVNVAKNFIKSLGKEYVIVNRDVPGFLFNRINTRIFIECVRLLEEGATAHDVDAMVRFRLGWPMGGLETLDIIGVDVFHLGISEMSKRGYPLRIPKTLEEMVLQGKLGVKRGEGFYKYPKPGAYVRPPILPTENMFSLNPFRLIATAVNEACWLFQNGVCIKEDVDKAMVLGMNLPMGILQLADRIGIDYLYTLLKQKFDATGFQEYKPNAMLEKMVEEKTLGLKTGKGFYAWNYERTDFGPIRYEKRHDHAVISICRPEKLNALNEACWKGLRSAFEKAAVDEDIRAVILMGEGRAFSSGDDISMMDLWKKPLDAKIWLEKFANPLMEIMSNYMKPIITLVNGLAFGGGMELNVVSDIVIASEDALFAQPEVLIGAFPPVASIYGVGLMGKRYIRYILTGEWMTAKQAKDLGLVDITVPSDQLEATGAEFVLKILRASPLATEFAKTSINILKNAFYEIHKTAVKDFAFLPLTDEFKEGIKAFLEKRPPKWVGSEKKE
ncbi:MAG: 3-hydroxyacyl-CoA dehydrogenase/enoyl-CoA hydratase family protein, partial [Candidatus Bathyarchaeia archaeon]